MDQDVHVRDAVRQERIPDVEDPPGDVGDVAAVFVDGHDAAEIRRRGHFCEERPAYTGGAAGDGDDGRTEAFRGRHEVLTLH
ncbi:hypothetical protein GCM10023193_39190 [Planotetraspora kaengkrachanensis]|uniref:Uncharacterized protein n=1 Tax=Planotetraspora kaengkrachanensis TaxID=575193 RepID=A0A8J3LWR5_9ACTN|nr:hypothetical protein Pka01_32390 [Planotetraspora kaengkrachanensis]